MSTNVRFRLSYDTDNYLNLCFGMVMVLISKCNQNLYFTSGLSILIHGVISLPDVELYDKVNSQ